jgi:hypothetical protein
MQTKRQYAASLGLAKLGVRGQMSKEALAAIESARANGIQFSDEQPKPDKAKRITVRVVGDSKPKEKTPEHDPRVVRDWARRMHINVGERGRVNPDIVRQYFLAHPDEIATPAETAAGKPAVRVITGPRAETVRPKAPQTRTETQAWILSPVGRRSVPVAFERCASCGHSVSRCTHSIPVAPAYLGDGTVSFSKPLA